MSTHVERMKLEHEELETKVIALNAFIYDTPAFRELNIAEQARMIRQAGFMEAYSATLVSRIWAVRE